MNLSRACAEKEDSELQPSKTDKAFQSLNGSLESPVMKRSELRLFTQFMYPSITLRVLEKKRDRLAPDGKYTAVKVLKRA